MKYPLTTRFTADTQALPLAASVPSDQKRNFKKQILDFGMWILDLRYSAFLN